MVPSCPTPASRKPVDSKGFQPSPHPFRKCRIAPKIEVLNSLCAAAGPRRFGAEDGYQPPREYHVPMAEAAERDRYLFGNLESSAQNRAKVREVNYGFEQPEGVFLT